MEKKTNQQSVEELASHHLGQAGGAGYSDQYDPSLLVSIPRHFNREDYGIKQDDLPFVGVDTWNAYEVSAITEKGLPVSGMLKIVYSSSSINHVESKSIKLYLNSFNMTKIGTTIKECIEGIETMVKKDLKELLETDVVVSMYTNEDTEACAFKGFPDIETLIDLDQVDFTAFKSDINQLEGTPTKDGESKTLRVSSNLLRSNCRVTNQPDWGNIFISIRGKNTPTLESLAKYIVSHRTVSHFHEEIAEMVFTHLSQAYKPEELMVACLYTRRGGLDINPIRATHNKLIPDFFIDTDLRIQKTLRQ